MNQNIYIKLEIIRNPKTGKVGISTHFDPYAPNFTKDKNGFTWQPTIEERELLNEAIDLLLKKKSV